MKHAKGPSKERSARLKPLVRQRRMEGVANPIIAEEFGLSPATVWRWAHDIPWSGKTRVFKDLVPDADDRRRLVTEYDGIIKGDTDARDALARRYGYSNGRSLSSVINGRLRRIVAGQQETSGRRARGEG